MFGNMFRGMIFGRGNRPDLSPEDLPANRWALFFEMLKIRWGKLIQLNLLFFLFMIPLVLWGSQCLGAMTAMAVDIMENGVSDTELLSLFMFWLMGNIPLSLISGLAMPGLARVCRNWARDEHAWVWADFIGALKANWKQALAVSLLTSVMTYLLVFAFFQYPYIVGGGLLATFTQTLMVVFLALVWLTQIILWPMMVTYDLKLGNLLRNALMLTVGRLPFTLAIGVGLLLPVAVVVLAPTLLVLLIVSILYIFFGLSFSMFVCASYANAVFDRFINPRIAGAPVDKGLRPKEFDPEDSLDADVWNQFDDTKKS